MALPTVSDRSRAYVRARAEAQMNCTVSIYEHPTQTFSEITGKVESTFVNQIYTGKARIYSIDGGGSVAVGDSIISTKSSFCSIPWNTPYIPVDSIIVIEDLPTDPFNEATVWRVLSTDGGGLIRAVRRMQITAWTPSSQWENA